MNTSTPTYDVYLDGFITTGTLEAALTAFDVAVAEVCTTSHILAQTTHHAHGAVIVRPDAPPLHYLLAPRDTQDRAAWAALFQARLRQRWPAAAFALRPVRDWNDTEQMRLSWTDGPTRAEVIVFLADRYGFHRLDNLERHFDRVLSACAWRVVAALADTTPSLRVPRTAHDDIDWATAAEITPEIGPVNIAGLVFDTETAPPLSVAEIVRELAHHVDLSRISPGTAARVAASSLALTDPHHEGPVRVGFADGTSAVVVGYLAVEDRARLVPGTPVTALEPAPATDDTSPLLALIEIGEYEVIDIAADGTVTRRDSDGSATATRWILYPVDRDPDTGHYTLTRHQVTIAPTDVAQIVEGFIQSQPTITEIYR